MVGQAGRQQAGRQADTAVQYLDLPGLGLAPDKHYGHTEYYIAYSHRMDSGFK